MTDHHCPTGHHTVVSYVCYSHHGCRCDGCRREKVARNRYDRRATGTRVVTIPNELFQRVIATGLPFATWVAQKINQEANV